MNSIIGALLGLTAACGIILITVGLRRRAPSPAGSGGSPVGWPGRIDPTIGRRIAVALVAGLVIVAVTGWFAPALIAAGLIWLIPHTITSRAAMRRDRERLRALASWIEIIRDLFSSGAGIEDAIVASQQHCAPVISVDVAQLVIDTHVKGARHALHGFGERFATPIADDVVWALTIATDRSSAAISEVLTNAAMRARERVSTQEKIDAKRSSRYSVVNAMVVMTFLLGGALVVLNPAYRAYYGTTVGQLVLTGIVFTQGAGFVALMRMARHHAGYRLPVSPPPSATSATPTAIGVRVGVDAYPARRPFTAWSGVSR